MTAIPKPSVGRIVHYRAFGSPKGEYKPELRAAIIAEVLSETRVKLCVFNPTGIHWNESDYAADPEGGQWCWPARENAF